MQTNVAVFRAIVGNRYPSSSLIQKPTEKPLKGKFEFNFQPLVEYQEFVIVVKCMQCLALGEHSYLRMSRKFACACLSSMMVPVSSLLVSFSLAGRKFGTM